MKKSLIISLAATLISFANVSHADFTIRTLGVNGCSNLAGQWAGVGQVSNWMIDCNYHGSGQMSGIDGAGKFTLNINIDKDSGSFLCPAHTSKQLEGTCVNGNLYINTGYGDLSGSVSQNIGNAKGTLTIAPGVSADVSIQFQRAG
jgi:hypothetical protein